MAILMTVSFRPAPGGIQLLAGSSASLSLTSSCENRKEGRASSGCSGRSTRSHACNGPHPSSRRLAWETRVHVCSAHGFCKSCHPGDYSASRGSCPSFATGRHRPGVQGFSPQSPFSVDSWILMCPFYSIPSSALLSSFYIQKTHFAKLLKIGEWGDLLAYRKHRHLYVKSRNTCNLTLQ